MIKKLQQKYIINKPLSQKELLSVYGENFNPLLANLLFVRGIKEKEDIEHFLDPKWDYIHDPFLFNDMQKAVKRIFKAIQENQNILIFSDYDTDGIPGGAILYNFFEKIGYQNFRNYIPDRNKDGYGLTEKQAQKIKQGTIFFKKDIKRVLKKHKDSKQFFKPDLVITVDCGITDVASAKLLKKAKIDLIITDHHIPQTLPDAFAIINPKVKTEKYPDKNLAGAGVAFKLVSACLQHLEKNNFKIGKKKFEPIPNGWEKWLLDLLSISTVCDMVPLIGENRVFVKYGQLVLAKTQRTGLGEIIAKARLHKNKITADDLGFAIGPRINAASRLENPFISFWALAGKKEVALENAKKLEKLNNSRKYQTAKIMKEVWKKLEKRNDQKVIVIGNKTWPLGILGLIAGKIADKKKLPVFVWSEADTETNGILKGSCRSGNDYSVFSLMSETEDQFLGFGGHKKAGGFSLLEENIHTLEQILEENIDKIEKLDPEKKVIDSTLTLDDINFQNYTEIEKLEPYGMANQRPLFLFKDIIIQNVKKFGKSQEHLELSFFDSRGFTKNAICFYFKDFFPQEVLENKIKEQEKINLVGSIENNKWNGNNFLRIKIEDIL
ncbi:hypothetical protein CSB11_00360 [Candidatus Campbellbacteria bacterium]|nr:MAG: hypothetical protein CSB11_00360 [Candidatus Campbellbacteria bacterium]